MAGTIFVTLDHAVAMSTVGFDLMSNAIRQQFSATDAAVKEKIFWHQDVGGMTAIWADELDVDEFAVFADRVAAAHQAARAETDLKFLEACWDELADLIARDQRRGMDSAAHLAVQLNP